MPVCRVEKTSNYTVMSNHHLQNRELTLRSKGLLSLMLSLPDNWDYTIEGLVTLCKEGRESIRAGIKELEEAGYIIRNRIRDASGRVGDMEYVIYENPTQSPASENPTSENPTSENPTLENPTLEKPTSENPRQLNTNIQSTNRQNTKEQNHCSSSGEQGEQLTHHNPSHSSPRIDTPADKPPLTPAPPSDPLYLDPDEARAQQDMFDDLEHTLRQCGFTPTAKIMLNLKDLMLDHGLEKVKQAIEIAGGGENTRHIRYIKGILRKEAEQGKTLRPQIIIKPGENPFADCLEE